MQTPRASRMAIALLFLGSVAVIGAALLFQYAGGLAPCELCLYERWPYYAAIPLALAALPAHTTREDARVAAILLLLVFVASGALAFYHVGVEQHWFAGPTACTGSGPVAKTIEELQAQLMTQQPVRCDQPQFSSFGITLAGWNLVASVALAALSLTALRTAAPGRRA
jgi:disulfide bond formation protein DsbB